MKQWVKMALGGCLGVLLIGGTWASAADSGEATFNGVSAEVAQKMTALDMQDLLENKEDGQYDAVMAAAPYAYMNLEETQDEATRQKILEARNTIIFSQSWKADPNLEAFVGNIETGERYDVPSFYEVFPSDWEIPDENGGVNEQIETTEETAMSAQNADDAIMAESIPDVVMRSSNITLYRPYLRKPSTTSATTPFVYQTAPGEKFCTTLAYSLENDS